jgi:zinc transporter ZupT
VIARLSLRWRNALTVTAVVAVMSLLGAPLLVYMYPELRRAIPEFPSPMALGALLALAATTFVAIAWHKGHSGSRAQ